MPMSTSGLKPAIAAPAAMPQKPISAMGGDFMRLPHTSDVGGQTELERDPS